jgi:hydrogenase maturation protease
VTRPSVLVACIGNIFFGDDAFGVEVARKMAVRELPPEARVVDFGIRGLDLVYALLDGYELTILVDAMPRGGEPGTIYVVEPDLGELDDPAGQAAAVEAHGMNPMKTLSLARSMGAEFKRILIVGCEPGALDVDEERMGLSAPVEAAVDEAVRVVESLVAGFLNVPAGAGGG